MRIKIAGIVFDIASSRLDHSFFVEQACRDFRCRAEPEVTVHGSYDGVPDIPLREENKVFDSEVVWSLYRVDGQNVFALRLPVLGLQPYRIAVFEADFRHGEVYSALPETPDDPIPNPLEYPLSEVLMICLLAQGRGLMVHACGIDDNGCGYLFAGNSTHGKTTMARLWRDRATILNDDRIVLRRREGRFWMYGTPWHGEYTGVSPRGVPVDKIFFLRHAETNRFRRIEGAAAASMLLARSFPPLWDAEGMSYTLDFCGQLVESVPCCELDFAPNESIVDFVRCSP